MDKNSASNEALENIFGRRSTRAFTSKEISRKDLETIVEAAKCAPTARNRRLRKFTVVQNKEMLEKINAVLGKVLERENYNMYGATALVICSDKQDNPFRVEDCACSLENIFLAAHSLKIGSVWINQFNGVCDHPEVRAILDELNIPANHAVYGTAALGYGMIPKKATFDFSEEVEWIL